ncbi:uncharacterized protein [Branchiostoma lanceolatum]|uniref:uncharacterized protein n=1 Tax=Branchiostoma lanceolatum TaxID=7740 RepID=UPI003453969C
MFQATLLKLSWIHFIQRGCATASDCSSALAIATQGDCCTTNRCNNAPYELPSTTTTTTTKPTTTTTKSTTGTTTSALTTLETTPPPTTIQTTEITSVATTDVQTTEVTSIATTGVQTTELASTATTGVETKYTATAYDDATSGPTTYGGVTSEVASVEGMIVTQGTTNKDDTNEATTIDETTVHIVYNSETTEESSEEDPPTEIGSVPSSVTTSMVKTSYKTLVSSTSMKIAPNALTDKVNPTEYTSDFPVDGFVSTVVEYLTSADEEPTNELRLPTMGTESLPTFTDWDADWSVNISMNAAANITATAPSTVDKQASVNVGLIIGIVVITLAVPSITAGAVYFYVKYHKDKLKVHPAEGMQDALKDTDHRYKTMARTVTPTPKQAFDREMDASHILP